jgi:inner membrane protein
VDSDIISWIWLIAGVLLCAIELFIPALVVVFLGLSAMFVALLRFAGIVDSHVASFFVWVIVSVVMVLSLRKMVRKYFPASTNKADIDEDTAAFGQVVDVITATADVHQNGRIRFQGTTWPAITTVGVIAAGQKAKVVFRDNLVWVVEPVQNAGLLEDNQSVLVPQDFTLKGQK